MFDTEALSVAEMAVKSLSQQFDNEVALDAITPKPILGDGVWFPGIVLEDGKEGQVRTDVDGNPREVHFIGSNAFAANIPDGHRWSIDLVTGVVTSEHW
jgi:hypothetical protein